MKVACYARVSSQKQAQQQTIQQQLERLRESCQSQGWPWQEDYVYRDDGYSGASLKRPALERLREQVALASFDVVLITAPDRLARNYVHQVLLVDELQASGAQVSFVEHPMSQDPHDQLLLQIRGAVAEYERSLIAERMRRGRQSKLRAGTMLPWTRAPYGYRLSLEQPRDPRGVRVEESEAVQVVAIFARYLEPGQTLGKLARHLMGLGVPTPGGKSRWNTSTLRCLLSNPSYTGTLYANRVRAVEAKGRRSALEPISQRATTTCVAVPQEEWIVVGHIPALVSVEQFEQVQAKLVHTQACASRHNTAQSYLLRALVSCGACAHACYGRTQGPYSYYVCRTKQQHAVDSRCDERCKASLIPSKQLDELVWRDLCALMQQPEIIAQALQRAQGGAWLPQEWQARKKSVRQAVSQLHGQMERLTEAYVAGVLPLAEYRRRRQDLQERLRAVDNQARLLEAQMEQQRDLTPLAGSISALCQRVGAGLEHASFEQQRHLVELLIDRVVVTGNQVEIRYVIPTSPHGEHVRFCHLRTDYFGTVGTPF